MRHLMIVAFLAVSSLNAAAHEPRKGPNGGALVDAGTRYHVEMIVKGTEEVILILSDAKDQPVSAAGFKANAILVVGGKPHRFPLEPAEGSRLVGKAPVAVPAGTKGAVQLTAPDGATSQAKF